MINRKNAKEILEDIKNGHVYNPECIHTKLLRMGNMPLEEYFESNPSAMKRINEDFKGDLSYLDMTDKEVAKTTTVADWASRLLEEMPKVREGMEEEDGPYAAYVWKFFSKPVGAYYDFLIAKLKKKGDETDD